MTVTHLDLMEDLCGFVRRAKHKATDPAPPDVQAAIKAIGYRPSRHIVNERKDNWRLNLKDAKLTGIVLAGSDLARAVFRKAYFGDAVLDHSNFSGALLEGATLVKTKLDYADLTEAELIAADLSRANLTGANLAYADMTSANLTEANMTDAVLVNTNMTNANLTKAKGIKQSTLDKAMADRDTPPIVTGAICAETGTPLVWQGKEA